MQRRLLIDLGPLRSSKAFRYLFEGQTVSMIGSQLTVVAVAFQVFELTHSSLQVGAVSLAQLPTFLLGTQLGGALGDAVDQRRLLVASSCALALLSLGLALNATAGDGASLPALYVLTATSAGLAGVVATATTAAIPALVTSGELAPAYALTQVVDQVGMVVGPLFSGVLIAVIGLPWLYGIDAATFIWSAVFLGRVATSLPRLEGARPRLRSIIEGFGYLRGRQDLQGAYLIDLCATVFGLPRALFPALASSVFHGGAATLGLLYACPAAGALVGSLASGWIRDVRRQGRAIVVAVMAWGTAVMVFGFVSVLWLALLLLALAGWADLVSAVLRSAMVQSAVDESFRHRISGMQMAVVEGGPRLGDLESGAVATATSTRFSIVSGGLVTLVGAVVVAFALPGFWRYRGTPGGDSSSTS
jgi:hypothetical protein